MLGGRYRLERLVARGGMAEVWEAHDALLDRRVAVKTPLIHLRSRPEFTERFQREAVAAASLGHPNVVAVYDTGSEDGFGPYIVMELFHGPSLRDVLRAEGRLPVERAVGVAVKVATALGFAHQRGIVHRDIKPANVLIDGEDVKVVDFGIAKAAEAADDLTQTNLTLGTARYLSPEQVEGRPLDARSDLYALGVVLYEMVCGAAPFDADSEIALALKHVTAEPVAPSASCPGLPPWLDGVVLRALAKDPADRFDSAASFRQALLTQGRSDVAAPVRSPAPSATASAPAAPHPAPAAVGEDTTGRLARTAALSRAAVGVADADAPAGGSGPALPGPGFGTVGPADEVEHHPGAPVEGRHRHRRGLPAASVALLAVLVAAAVFFGLHRPASGPSTGTTGAGAGTNGGGTGTVVALSAAHSYNPLGDGTEHEETVGNLIDGNPSTEWATEHYANPAFGNLKSGVGAYVELARPGPVSRLVISSPSSGWQYEIFELDGTGAPPSLSGWGAPVARGTVGGSTTTVGLPHRSTGLVLLWITNLGPGNSSVSVGELTLYS